VSSDRRKVDCLFPV